MFAAIILLAMMSCNGKAPPPDRGNFTQSTPKVIELTARDFAFEPKAVHYVGREAVGVGVKLVSRGSVMHNITIPKLNLNKDLIPGNTAGFLLTFPSSGTYAFYCRFHRDRGMKGIIQADLIMP